MPDWVSKLLVEPIKAVTLLLQHHFWSIAAFVAAMGWLLTLGPSEFFTSIYVESLRTSYLETIGAVTFISTFILCFGAIYKGYTAVRRYWSNRQNARQREELLHSLTPVEYEYLYKFVEDQSQTATFTLFDGVVAGLIDKGILYKADSRANRAAEQDFNLYPWAYDYLSKQPMLFHKRNHE